VTDRSQPSNLRPPDDLDGWDPAWSRIVDAPDHAGMPRRWHLLDTGPADARRTILAVHGNPTWAYTWRHLAAAVPGDVRVIAPDQLDMGFSERTGVHRRLAQRIDDLLALTDSLELTGDVVVVAHDWGGPVALGWLERTSAVVDSPIEITGLVLTNTAVHQPPEASAPTLIRNARRPWLLPRATVDTTAFLRGMFELSNPRTPTAARRGYLAPYGSPDRRRAIAEFVEDIPLEPNHPTAGCLDQVAAGLADLHAVPTLLVWGAGDRVFSDIYLHDLEARLPHAEVHRHPTAGHLVSEDIDVASIVTDWLETLDDADHRRTESSAADPVDLTARLRDPAVGERVAIAELGEQRTVTFSELDTLVQATAEGLLTAGGVRSGDRVALMVPPGIDLAVALYACWRAGAVPVLIDSGLGPRQMSAAMRVANPDHVIGVRRALSAAKALRWPGRRIAVASLPAATRRLLGVEHDLESLRQDRRPVDLPTIDPQAEAAVVFTSGATGPSKGVRYGAAQIDAQIRLLIERYEIGPDDSLVAAFAPFALYGPAMGITSTVPDIDVSRPGSLTASLLRDAVDAVDATLVFASPAAVLGVVETADTVEGLDRAPLDRVRLLLSAGAPVPAHALRNLVDELLPNATARTPYGMTECLPVADIDLTTLEVLDERSEGLAHLGVCVGDPLPGVEIAIAPLDHLGNTASAPTHETGRLGEVWVRAPHQRLGYDRLWHTTHLASPSGGWHATGDLGAVDHDGRLWIGGRIGHVIRAAAGPVAPAAIERAVDRLDHVRRCAAVGVGPPGAQIVAIIAETADAGRRPRQADLARLDEIRRTVDGTVGLDVAACLELRSLPVDRRHNSKIDRSYLAAWAAQVFEGGPVRNP